MQEVTTEEQAKKVGEFLTSENTFDQTWAPEEKTLVQKAPVDSLKNWHHKYWFIEKDGEIIATGGVRENKYGSGGYEMDADYIAVHKNYRRKGLGKEILQQIEKYVKSQGGRYIHVLSCDIESYGPAREMYKSVGYKEVSHIPDYYVEGEGRIDFFKKI